MRENIDKIITKFIEIRDLLDMLNINEVYDKIDEISAIYKNIGSVIETKYFIGQKVWLIFSNTVTSYEIEAFKCVKESTLTGSIVSEKYRLCGINDTWFDVSQLFPSKEELIKSL